MKILQDIVEWFMPKWDTYDWDESLFEEEEQDFIERGIVETKQVPCEYEGKFKEGEQ
jgi:hypothetical protein